VGAPTKILQDCGIDTSALRLLYELHGDEAYALSVAGEDAVEEWGRLWAVAGQTGCWPVLVGVTGEENIPTTHEVYYPEEETGCCAGSTPTGWPSARRWW
jgi:hypothetical protein